MIEDNTFNSLNWRSVDWEKLNELISDWTQCADSPISEEQKAEWAQYRQALRDMPEQDGFPYTIVWPRKQQADGTVSAENYQD